MTDFEDPTALARCIHSDCESYRAGGTPFCAAHLREQETKSPGIVEPEVEERVAKVRTEDDEHPGMVKVYDGETGKASWVPEDDVIKSGAPGIHRAFAGVGMPPAEELYVGPDPDVNGAPLRIHVPSWDEKVGITPEMRAQMSEPPDPTELEPHWDGTQWVLRPKQEPITLACPHCGEKIEVRLS